MALPKDFKMPSEGGNYVKFGQGDTQVRVMSDWIVGYEIWVHEDGTPRMKNEPPRTGDKPIRKRMDERISPDDLGDIPPKLFWAAVVFDRADSKMKIMEITQKSIMRTLQGLEGDEDWGDPKGDKGYDIVITREGEGLETRYETKPKPKKKLDEGVVQLYKDANIKLNKLFSGENPFGDESFSDEELDKIEEALS